MRELIPPTPPSLSLSLSQQFLLFEYQAGKYLFKNVVLQIETSPVPGKIISHSSHLHLSSCVVKLS